jgi:hypothetical protein
MALTGVNWRLLAFEGRGSRTTARDGYGYGHGLVLAMGSGLGRKHLFGRFVLRLDADTMSTGSLRRREVQTKVLGIFPVSLGVISEVTVGFDCLLFCQLLLSIFLEPGMIPSFPSFPSSSSFNIYKNLKK